MLLKVNLCSPGVIEDRGHWKRKYPAATKLHIYNTLVAWFLSLVSGQWLLSSYVSHTVVCFFEFFPLCVHVLSGRFRAT